MTLSWVTLYPGWYIRERRLLERHYPDFRVDEAAKRTGILKLYGELTVRPPGGAKRYPIRLEYPAGAPFEHPVVTPIKHLPQRGADDGIVEEPEPEFFDRRHQMPQGNLCLFQRETRAVPGGDVMDVLRILRRAEQWFIGFHTGRWPPDTAQSELESHFECYTDALIAQSFYGDDLDGYGRFFLVPNVARYSYTNPDDPDVRTFILTALTEESTGVVRPFDARRELARIYPWVERDLWDANKLAASPNPDAAGNRLMAHGYWWSLPCEPKPFRDGGGLLRELASAAPNGDAWSVVTNTLKQELTASDQHFLAFRYPSREGGFDWVTLWMPRGPRSTPGGVVLIKDEPTKRKEFEGCRLYLIRSHKVDPGLLRLRNRTVIEDSVAEKTVALIGLGALGSRIAELLGQAGVGRFCLCDSDHLATGNVARHVGGVSDYGMPKTRVVMKRLLEINPMLEFSKQEIIAGSIVASLDQLRDFLERADAVVCTTADESVESVVNQVAVMLRKPVIYGRSMRRASFGRVFLVRPGRDACKSCLAHYMADGRANRATPDDWIDVPESDDDILLHECGRPVIAGSAVDLSFTAGLTARVVLDLLEGKSDDQNHWLWSRLPAADVDPRLAPPLSTFVGHLPPRPGCPACQEPDVVRLLISDDALAFIRAETESSPDRETGGLLIGYVDDRNCAIALRATGPGPNAERTAARFRRDIPYVQSELDRAADELGVRGAYIGEWHSHLVPDPQPSAVDIESLSGISAAPNYLTRCPAMMIVGLDPTTTKVANVGCWTFPIGGRVYPIPHVSFNSVPPFNPPSNNPSTLP